MLLSEATYNQLYNLFINNTLAKSLAASIPASILFYFSYSYISISALAASIPITFLATLAVYLIPIISIGAIIYASYTHLQATFNSFLDLADYIYVNYLNLEFISSIPKFTYNPLYSSASNFVSGLFINRQYASETPVEISTPQPIASINSSQNKEDTVQQSKSNSTDLYGQIFNMSLLITLSVVSSIAFALFLGPTAPLMLYISPLITIAAINISQYLKDITNFWLIDTATSKLEDYKKILPSKDELERIDISKPITIQPGEVIPIDCELLSPCAIIKDYTIKTGESDRAYEIKRSTREQTQLYAGTRNVSKYSIEVQAIRPALESVLYKNLELLEQEQEHPDDQNTMIIDIISRIFVPFVIIVAIATLLYWGSVVGFSVSVGYMIDVICAACPCALAIANSTPLAIAKNMAFANNIFIHKEKILTKLSLATRKTFVFDKTNTLTRLSLDSSKIKTISNTESGSDPQREIPQDLILKYLYIAQKARLTDDNSKRASDPYANAVTRTLKQTFSQSIDNDSPPHCRLVENTDSGLNLEILDISQLPTNIRDARRAYLYSGSKRYLVEKGFNQEDLTLASRAKTSQNTSEVYTVMSVEDSMGQIHTIPQITLLEFEQTLRDDAAVTLNTLRARGHYVRMATGDNDSAAATVASSLDFAQREYIANCSPEQKAAYIKSLKEQGHNVVVVGDGFNDILQALEANVGSIAVDKSSVMSGFFDATVEELSKIINLLDLADATTTNQYFTYFLSIACNLFTILLAAVIFPLAGYTMMMGCFGTWMALSSFLALAWSCVLIFQAGGILDTNLTDLSDPDLQKDIIEDRKSGKEKRRAQYQSTSVNDFVFNIIIQLKTTCCGKVLDNPASNIEELQRRLTQIQSSININLTTSDSIAQNKVLKRTINFRVATDKPEQLEQEFSALFTDFNPEVDYKLFTSSPRRTETSAYSATSSGVGLKQGSEYTSHITLSCKQG